MKSGELYKATAALLLLKDGEDAILPSLNGTVAAGNITTAPPAPQGKLVDTGMYHEASLVDTGIYHEASLGDNGVYHEAPVADTGINYEASGLSSTQVEYNYDSIDYDNEYTIGQGTDTPLTQNDIQDAGFDPKQRSERKALGILAPMVSIIAPMSQNSCQE